MRDAVWALPSTNFPPAGSTSSTIKRAFLTHSAITRGIGGCASGCPAPSATAPGSQPLISTTDGATTPSEDDSYIQCWKNAGTDSVPIGSGTAADPYILSADTDEDGFVDGSDGGSNGRGCAIHAQDQPSSSSSDFVVEFDLFGHDVWRRGGVDVAPIRGESARLAYLDRREARLAADRDRHLHPHWLLAESESSRSS